MRLAPLATSLATETFIRHADLVHQATRLVSELFYPKLRRADGWSAHIRQSLRTAADRDPKVGTFVDSVVGCIEQARDFRNACEHPDEQKAAVLTDYKLKVGPKISAPVVEIRHPRSPVGPAPVLPFMDEMIDASSGAFEDFCALLCSENIKLGGADGPFDCKVSLVPDEQVRHGVRYIYDVTIRQGFSFPQAPGEG